VAPEVAFLEIYRHEEDAWKMAVVLERTYLEHALDSGRVEMVAVAYLKQSH
jgi:hypothetical protein